MADASSTVRSGDFWFKDGDTVLSVTEDDVEHQFRVHRSILIIASPVFRHMLRDYQSVVTLSNDSVDDVTALLGALYVGRFVISTPRFEIYIDQSP
jgi:BTB/POZ domain